MNELNHVAIIMDGNGRWGLKRKEIQEIMVICKALKTSRNCN